MPKRTLPKSMQTVQRKLRHPYITRKKGVCGGKPIIVGTRIRVQVVAIECEKMGYTPDEIVRAHPHLTLAQVHDALSYYYDNIEEIDRDIAEERRFVAEMKKLYPSILKAKKRERISD